MYDYFILATLAVIALFSKPSEMRVLVVFSGICTLMLMIGQVIKEDYLYYYPVHYWICIYLHAIIIFLINREVVTNNFINHICTINHVFIYLNLFGFYTYMHYVDSVYFNIGCEVLYSLALVAVFYKWYCNGLWDTGIHRVISFFRSNMRSCIPQLCLSKEEERT